MVADRSVYTIQMPSGVCTCSCFVDDLSFFASTNEAIDEFISCIRERFGDRDVGHSVVRLDRLVCEVVVGGLRELFELQTARANVFGCEDLFGIVGEHVEFDAAMEVFVAPRIDLSFAA